MSRRRVQVAQPADLWTSPDAEVSLLRRPLVELLARIGPDYLHRTQLRFLQTGTELLAKSHGGVEFKYRLAGLLRRGKWSAKELRYPVFASLPLYRILNSLPDQEIGLTWSQPATTTLHASAATFQIPTLWEQAAADPVPATPQAVAECHTADWLAMCANVCPYAKSPPGERESRFQQCQLSMQRSAHGSFLTMSGTDARMLAVGAADAFRTSAVDPPTVRMLARDLSWANRMLVATSPEYLRVEYRVGGLELAIHDLWLRIPYSAAYAALPDFQVVCRPTEAYTSHWQTTAQDLSAALLAVVSFQTAAAAQPVELVLSSAGVVLRSQANGWTATVRAAGEYAGSATTAWFDARRLLQCLKGASPQAVRLRFGDNVLDDAIRVEFPACDSFYLLMPMAPDSGGDLPDDRAKPQVPDAVA